MKLDSSSDLESPPVVIDLDTNTLANGKLDSTPKTAVDGSRSKCTPTRWIIVIVLVLIAIGAVVGTLVGLNVVGGGGGDGDYRVETKWSIVRNCVYSYCYSRTFYETSGRLNVGESITEHAGYGALTTTLKSVNGNEATFEVSSTVTDCVRTRTTTATVDSDQHGPWSPAGSCGVGGGQLIVTKAQVKIS